MGITTALIWLLATLIVVTLFSYLAKRYGVEYLIAAMGFSIIIANITSLKIVSIGGIELDAGTLVFPMTFLISDILSEFWGKKTAQRAIWIGFLGLLFYLLITQIVFYMAPAAGMENLADAYNTLFSLAPRLVAGSLVAYVIVQHFDVWLYHKIKKHTGEKHLWIRNNVSTITSQLLDSIIFVTIAFYGFFPILPLILANWGIKSLIAVIDTPFLYFIRLFMKKADEEKTISNNT